MGKNYQGINGNWSGKVGNNVGHIRGGRTIISVYQPQVANPQTTAQMRQRQKMQVIVQMLSAMEGFIRAMWTNVKSTSTAWSECMGYNMKNAVGGTYPNQEVAFNNAKVGSGKTPLPYNPSASVDSNTLSLSWADNSGDGDAKSTDKMNVAVYNSTKHVANYELEVADRSSRTHSMAIPTSWNGDSVEVYCAMSAGSEGGDTFYLGSFTV